VFPEQPHLSSLPSIKNQYNFSFRNGQLWFVWEERRQLMHKVPSPVEAEILLRVRQRPPHTLK
jgi:hypothetical protein